MSEFYGEVEATGKLTLLAGAGIPIWMVPDPVGGLATVPKEPVHDLPELPNWRSRHSLGLYRRRGPPTGTTTRDGECTVSTTTHTYVLGSRSIAEPLVGVVVVEVAGSSSAGGGFSAAGFGGSLSGPLDNIYRVVRYEVGLRFEYQFVVTTRVIVRDCPGTSNDQWQELPAEGKWVLVKLIHDAICSRTVLAEGIDKREDATRIADRNAPADSGVLRSHPDAGLADQ